MDRSKKILIIDKAIDRKKKISALKQAGYSVFPALKLQDARSRCRSGAYDLVIINAGDELQQAQEFCEELRGRIPSQTALLVVPAGAQYQQSNEVVQDDLDEIVSRVNALLPTSAGGASVASEQKPARATA